MEILPVDMSERTLCFAAVDVPREPAVMGLLPSVVQRLVDGLDLEFSGRGQADTYLARSIEKALLATVTPTRIAVMSLGTSPFVDRRSISRAIVDAIEEMGKPPLKRVGFKLLTFAPLGMSQAELLDLIFGSFLAPRSQVETDLGKVNDMALGLWGDLAGSKYIFQMTPQSGEQSAIVFTQTPNLEHLGKDRWVNPNVQGFLQRISRDCLSLDIDIYREDERPEMFEAFLDHAINTAAELVISACDRVRAKARRK